MCPRRTCKICAYTENQFYNWGPIGFLGRKNKTKKKKCNPYKK